MRVVISAGGTGGHIYPALSIINKIKYYEPDSEFLYIGTHNRMEKDIIPKYNIPFETIEIYGFNRKKIFKNFKTIKYIINSYKKCKKLIKEFNPDVVIGVGGYVTGPVIYAAKKLGFKTFIHEQNSVPGKCNLFLSKYVDKIGISLKSSIKYFPEYKCVFTGNPCSEEALNKDAQNKKDFGLSKDRKLVLFVMGSLGSTKVNEILIKTINLSKNKNYEILFVTGPTLYDEISKQQFPSNVHVVPYIENITRIMKNTDLIVSRAGASTLSEIIALKIPSILIPSPYVPDNHQYKNALDLVENDAAILIEEKNLNGTLLSNTIDELLNNNEKLMIMSQNLEKLYVPESATKVYETIKTIIDGK
ncbi:MAG: undecaprenyldiphospho-muramoylpentapeptide beta-N-acetylglucosaminyltransferase [Clostridium sp.]|nr:undecaprenyldiphospho-muramoylpentapeptide beta-N-acetylglucosaminyltransferase [Clostridium sp.]MCM1444323.1 undecaprenyldiphospho-muramoylpentapeptide beta-N-acetylglucosaminyltransferase [Candidatus Amulumruptor caecigallinarius]